MLVLHVSTRRGLHFVTLHEYYAEALSDGAQIILLARRKPITKA